MPANTHYLSIFAPITFMLMLHSTNLVKLYAHTFFNRRAKIAVQPTEKVCATSTPTIHSMHSFLWSMHVLIPALFTFSFLCSVTDKNLSFWGNQCDVANLEKEWRFIEAVWKLNYEHVQQSMDDFSPTKGLISKKWNQYNIAACHLFLVLFVKNWHLNVKNMTINEFCSVGVMVVTHTHKKACAHTVVQYLPYLTVNYAWVVVTVF